MNVRPATIDDAEAMAFVHCASFEAAYGKSRDLTQTEAVWRSALEGDTAAFVAEDEGAVVGVLSVGPAREEAGTGEVYVIYVLVEMWGSGAGQRLMERAHAVLAEHYAEAVLTVLAGNPRARRFYERNGWELEALETELHFGGEPTEVARYRRRLRDS